MTDNSNEEAAPTKNFSLAQLDRDLEGLWIELKRDQRRNRELETMVKRSNITLAFAIIMVSLTLIIISLTLVQPALKDRINGRAST